jgi:hypothetical protein
MVERFAGTGERIRVNQAADDATSQRLESQPPSHFRTAARFRTDSPNFSIESAFPQLRVSVSDPLRYPDVAEYRVKVLP